MDEAGQGSAAAPQVQQSSSSSSSKTFLICCCLLPPSPKLAPFHSPRRKLQRRNRLLGRLGVGLVLQVHIDMVGERHCRKRWLPLPVREDGLLCSHGGLDADNHPKEVW